MQFMKINDPKTFFLFRIKIWQEIHFVVFADFFEVAINKKNGLKLNKKNLFYQNEKFYSQKKNFVGKK